MSETKKKLGFLARAAEFDQSSVDVEAKTVSLSFSSEAPVQRDFGVEILDHAPESVDLARLENGAPLLWNHNRDDMIGVVDSASVSDRKGNAVVRFGSSQRAQEVFADVQSGIIQSVSVGYQINKMREDSRQGDLETYRATSWTPYELSLVSIPADTSVGVGRAADEVDTIIEQREQPKKDPIMSEEKKGPEVEVLVKNAQKAGREAEAKRQKEIRELAATGGDFVADVAERAEKAIAEGMSSDEFQRDLWRNMKAPSAKKTPEIELSKKEQQRYSIAKALREQAEGKLGGLELEVSKAIEDNGHKRQADNSVLVPFSALGMSMKRDNLVGTASLGGNLKETVLDAGNFIDVLRNRMVTARMGATVLDGLVGDLAIPRRSAAATAAWYTEAASAAESTATFDQVSLTPKALHGMSDYSVKLLRQSTPSIDALIADDLMNVVAIALDLAALHGSGSGGEPQGIAGATNVGSVAGGTNGANPDWADVVNLEREVAVDNADMGNLGYVTNAKVRAYLKQAQKVSTGTEGNFIWQDALNPGTPGEGTLNGYRALCSNQVADNLTKGTSTTICSAVFYGNWADLLIGNWGSLELMSDPYTLAANRLVRVHCYQFADVALRHGESFSAMLDALTS